MSTSAAIIPVPCEYVLSRSEGKMTSSETKQWALTESLFLALICAGYVALALCFFFMFNHVNVQI